MHKTAGEYRTRRGAPGSTQSRLSPDSTSHHAKKVVHPNGSCPDRHTSTTNTNMTCNHQSPVINCARIALRSAFLATLTTLAHQAPPTNPFFYHFMILYLKGSIIKIFMRVTSSTTVLPALRVICLVPSSFISTLVPLVPS